MSPPTTSFGAVEKVKAGDYDAFAALFAKYRGRLAAFLKYKAGPQLLSTTAIDDLLQETFLRAFRDIHGFTYESPGSFWRWLVSIATHVVLDSSRFEHREKRRAEMLRFRSETNPRGPDPSSDRTPSLLLAEKEAVERLFTHLDALTADYREVILLAKVEGLSTAEIALRIDKPRAAVALLLHRALKRFRELAGER